MNKLVRHKRSHLHVHADMTIYTAAGLKTELLSQLDRHPQASELDLSRVAEIDTAGLQILLLAHRCAREAGRELKIVNPSPAVQDVLRLCRLGNELMAQRATGGTP